MSPIRTPLVTTTEIAEDPRWRLVNCMHDGNIIVSKVLSIRGANKRDVVRKGFRRFSDVRPDKKLLREVRLT